MEKVHKVVLLVTIDDRDDHDPIEDWDWSRLIDGDAACIAVNEVKACETCGQALHADNIWGAKGRAVCLTCAIAEIGKDEIDSASNPAGNTEGAASPEEK